MNAAVPRGDGCAAPPGSAADAARRRGGLAVKCVAAATLAVCGLYVPVVVGSTRWLGAELPLSSGARVQLWPEAVNSALAAVCAMLLPALGWFGVRRASREPSSRRRVWFVLQPLALLPLAVLPAFARGLLPVGLSATVLFYWPVGCAAWSLLRLADTAASGAGQRPVGPRAVWVTSAGCALLFFLTGLHFTCAIGFHSGDEAHYVIQARSLYQDGDLDLRNNLPGLPPERRHHTHISRASRGDHWYSWHSFGLSLLLAPFAGGGTAARHAVLGVISGLGCGGALLACGLMGARLLPSLLVTVLTACSVLWGVYSSRALPEVLGATLAVWAFVGVLAHRLRPWMTLFVTALCCSFLPWAHTRFAPVALLFAGVYGVLILVTPCTPKGRLARAFAFGALMSAGLAIYAAVHLCMFEGGSAYPVSRLLFSEPLGMWYVVASRVGILYVLPSFAWLLAAALLLVCDRRRRMAAGLALLLLATVLATSCGTIWYAGGSSLSGRFLVVALLPLVACAAAVFDTAGRRERGWFLFLALASCAQFATLLANLPACGTSFSSPTATLSSVVPLLRGLLNPFLSPAATRWHGFGLILCAATIGLVWFGSRMRRATQVIVLALVGGTAVAGHWARHAQPPRTDPVGAATLLGTMDLRRTVCRARPAPAARPVPLLEVSNRFAASTPEALPRIVTEDLGERVRGNVFSAPRFEANDWSGRGYAWVTLVPPFKAKRGQHVLGLTGTVRGGCSVVFAVRKGEGPVLEERLVAGPGGAVGARFLVDLRGHGDVVLLARLEGGQGEFAVESLAWSPFSPALLASAGLTLPADARRIAGD